MWVRSHIRPTRSCSLSCCIYFVVKHHFWASYLSFSCLLLPWDSVQALVWHMCGPQPRPSHKIWRNTQTHPQMSQLPETHQHSKAETQIWIPLSIPGLLQKKLLQKICLNPAMTDIGNEWKGSLGSDRSQDCHGSDFDGGLALTLYHTQYTPTVYHTVPITYHNVPILYQDLPYCTILYPYFIHPVPFCAHTLSTLYHSVPMLLVFGPHPHPAYAGYNNEWGKSWWLSAWHAETIQIKIQIQLQM